MKTSGYLMQGSVTGCEDSYATSKLSVIRKVSEAFAEKYGAFKYSPIRLRNKDGQLTGEYGLAYWKTDKNGKNCIRLVSFKRVYATCEWQRARIEGTAKHYAEGAYYYIGTKYRK